MNRYSIKEDWISKGEEDRIGLIGERVRSSLDLTDEVSDERVYECIDQIILEETGPWALNLREKLSLRDTVFNGLRRLDVLQELLEDESVTEIMINGYENIFVERDGVVSKTDKKFFNRQRYEDIVQQIVSRANRIVNRTVPIVDARLEDGSRVNVILDPISIDGTTMTIRKFSDRNWKMDNLIELGSLDRRISEFLKFVVGARYNIIVAGGTGSGKTTFLNLVTEYIGKEERVVTIEDSAELNLKGIRNLVRLETRNANVEGEHSIELKDLIRASLRLRPDRIIVGEVRGEEAFYMINAAMNTGHDGSLSTCHANSCEDAVRRLETMVLMECEIPVSAIRRQIGSAVELIVHLGRLRDRSRKVLEISEVVEREGDEVVLNPLFVFQEEEEKDGKIAGRWRYCNRLTRRTKLHLSGLEKEFRRKEEEWTND